MMLPHMYYNSIALELLSMEHYLSYVGSTHISFYILGVVFTSRRCETQTVLIKSILDYSELFYGASTARSFSSESTLFDEMYNFIKYSRVLSGTLTDL